MLIFPSHYDLNMANLKIIKDLAAIKGMTIEQLAAKAKITTQAIHLMGRNGTTKMETFEKIAKILEVPPYVFFDDNFDIQVFQDYVVNGHHNPTSFFAPIYNDGKPLSTDGKPRDLIKAKDETILILRKQVDDLLTDKSEMRSEIQSLRNLVGELKEQLKCK